MVSEQTQSLVQRALGSLLEPVVLLLLKSGVTWKDFVAIAKATFVQVATREFGIRGRPTNVSRVAILTGMDRRDVAKLRTAPESPATGQPGFMSKPTQLLEGWYHDSEFLAPDGKPRELPIEGDDGSFTVLARRYAPGIPPVAMIKELRAAGAIEKARGHRLRVLKKTYIPRQLSDNKIRLWGSVLHDIGTTLEINISASDAVRTRFERRAISLAVDRRALPEFRAFLEAEGQAFLERVDEWLQSHRVLTADASESRAIRLGVGVYHIQEADKAAGRKP